MFFFAMKFQAFTFHLFLSFLEIYYFLQWGIWSSCNKPCGTGERFRFRECAFEDEDTYCPEDKMKDIQDCNNFHCPSKCRVTMLFQLKLIKINRF